MTDPKSPPIVLASGSAIRASILRDAGVDFQIMRPEVDEDAVKEEGRRRGTPLDEVAMALAVQKAKAVAAPKNALVVGADQIMAFKGAGFDKPRDLEEARARLLSLAGHSHELINATAVVVDGDVAFTHLERPRLFMRAFSPAALDAYLDEAGPQILTSVGAYQVEKLGARLFEKIEGDYFAVLGLALFPLLEFLRARQALAF